MGVGKVESDVGGRPDPGYVGWAKGVRREVRAGDGDVDGC